MPAAAAMPPLGSSCCMYFLYCHAIFSSGTSGPLLLVAASAAASCTRHAVCACMRVAAWASGPEHQATMLACVQAQTACKVEVNIDTSYQLASAHTCISRTAWRAHPFPPSCDLSCPCAPARARARACPTLCDASAGRKASGPPGGRDAEHHWTRCMQACMQAGGERRHRMERAESEVHARIVLTALHTHTRALRGVHLTTQAVVWLLGLHGATVGVGAAPACCMP